MGVSLKPSTFVEGGGLVDDVDATITDAKWLTWDYNGQSNVVVPALAVALTLQDGTVQEQYYSCGKLEHFKPSKDDRTPAPDNDCMGDYLVPVTDKTGIASSSNAGKFFASLVNAGYPEDKLDGPISKVLNGLTAHFKREVVKRTGLVRTGKNADRDQTVLVVSKVIKLPWETASRQAAVTPRPAAATAASPAAAKPNGAAGVGVSVEVRAKAEETLMGVLIEAGAPVPKAKLATLVFNALKGDPDQKAVSQLAFKDDFLQSVAGIRYDGAKVEMAA